MTLEEFIDSLLDAGVTGDEMKAAIARFKARNGGGQAIQRTGPAGMSTAQQKNGLDFPVSAQDYSRGPLTGEQQEAYEEFLRKEAADPNGLYSWGGSSAGGIFGGGAIALENYDPESQARAGGAMQAEVNLRMMKVLEGMEKRLESSDEEKRRQLAAQQQQPRLKPKR